MSDSLVTQDALVAPSDGQAQQASGQEAQSSTVGQPSTNGQAVTESENVAKLHRLYAQKEQTLKQQIDQSNRVIQQMQQQMREAQKNAAPDDYSKLEVDLQWERQEKQALMARLAEYERSQQEANARMNAFQEIATRYGVTPEEIDKANPTDYASAVEAAIEARDKRKQKQQQQSDDKRERNLPDVGGGAPATASSKWQQEYAEARQRKDSIAMMRLLQTRGQ